MANIETSADLVTRLYPQPSGQESLHGLYLSHDLRALADAMDRPFVYSDYVVSLDGRIAVPHSTKPGLTVPKAIANDRDWRLFQELAVQADVVITSGRYLRDYADGRAQEILRVYDDPRFADLKEWRLSRGLMPAAGACGDQRQPLVFDSRSVDARRSGGAHLHGGERRR